ncbi:MAG TPA: HlyD family efflux transporter periplasmic adaptor subunit [Steroidobacteraceae bacterium]|jgi:HlyD family secretion protein
MDKTIEKKGPSPWRWAAIGGVALAVVLLGWQLMSRSNSSRLTVDSSRLTTATVEKTEFLEYYPFDGTVQPATSVYLDVEQGGRVDEILVEGGQHVEKGDLILKLSNATLQRTSIDTETQLLYNLDIQRTTEADRGQSGLVLRENLLDLEHQIMDGEAKMRRYDQLIKDGNEAISQETYDIQKNLVQYLKNHRDVLKERIRRDDQLSEQLLVQVRRAIGKLNDSLELVGKIMKSLEVRAPISGYLSTIDAEIGQNIPAGQRIGQIDLLDKFKVRVKIDQFYIARVQVGGTGRINLDDKNWDVKVTKIYPEVKNSAFEADVVFTGDVPQSLKRGQSLTVELTFGSPSQTLTVAKGGFFQQTGGRWVYLISDDGASARKVDVRMGRQNPREVEVLEGLRPGDRIITSGYDTFNSVDQLKFNEPLKTRRDRS